MRNILLALTSFLATVLILSQVALADDEANNSSQSASSPQKSEPNEGGSKDRTITESGVPNAGHKCKDGTCFSKSKGGRLLDKTNPKPANVQKPGGSGSGSEAGKE